MRLQYRREISAYMFLASIWARTITALPEYKDASSISIYLSMPKGELQTNELVKDAFGKGMCLLLIHIITVSVYITPYRIVLE